MMKKPDLIFLSLTEAAKQLFGYEQVAKRTWKICLPKIKQVLNTKIKEEVLECYWHSRASLCDQEITLQYFFYTKKALRILRLYCNWKMSISVSEMTMLESSFFNKLVYNRRALKRKCQHRSN